MVKILLQVNLKKYKIKKGAKVILHKVLKPELFGVAKIETKKIRLLGY